MRLAEVIVLLHDISITNSNGIIVSTKKRKIFLDPKKPPESGLSFVSHAHLDHIRSSFYGKRVIASDETVRLARERGFNINNYSEQDEDIETFDAGHILGSRAILIDNSIFYTGDFALRPRAFLESGKAAKCDVLIMETTFGSPEYIFPPVGRVFEQTNRLIAEMFAKGVPVVLMGYPLGKSQILSYYFSFWDPVYVYESVAKMNNVHTELGVSLGTNFKNYEEAKEKGLLNRKPWVLLCPLMSGRNKFVKELKEKYGAVLVAFSGWACRPGYKNAMSVDYAFPVSDHCDFSELYQLVKQCSPKKVITVHGQNSVFAAFLQKQGYDAQPSSALHASMTDFIHED